MILVPFNAIILLMKKRLKYHFIRSYSENLINKGTELPSSRVLTGRKNKKSFISILQFYVFL
jgi:hypothetical protein